MPKNKYITPDGRQLSSVTQIIGDCTDKSGALTQWAANMTVEWIRQNCESSHVGFEALGGAINMPNYRLVTMGDLDQARFNFRDVSQEALDIGSETHDNIEHYLKTGKEPKMENPSVISAYIAFLEWADSVNLEVIEAEKKVYGKYYAGQLDLKCRINDLCYILDFKTSKAHYIENRYQIAAYRATQDDVEGSGVLRLDKETGLPDWKDHSKTHDRDLKVFMAMVDLYYLRHPINAKKAKWGEM